MKTQTFWNRKKRAKEMSKCKKGFSALPAGSPRHNQPMRYSLTPRNQKKSPRLIISNMGPSVSGRKASGRVLEGKRRVTQIKELREGLIAGIL